MKKGQGVLMSRIRLGKTRVAASSGGVKVGKLKKSWNNTPLNEISNKIVENAVRNITSIPTKPIKIYVDDNMGHKNNWDNSGLVPKYVIKDDYGEIPKYIVKRKEEIEEAQNEYEAYFTEAVKQNSMQELHRKDQEALLQCFKEKWDDLHHKYQGLSVVTDTAPKKERKEHLEYAMQQIEKDIQLLENHTKIYIN